MDQPTPIKYYLAIDIEGRGGSLFNPITAIGVYLAPVRPTMAGTRIKRRWALQPLPGDIDEEKCVSEFWARFPEVDAWIKREALPAPEVMKAFREWCRDMANIIGPGKITILTDSPDYDLGRLDYLGHRTGIWDKPIRFLDVGVRHSQADPSERRAQLSDAAQAGFKTWLAEHAPHAKHSHFPDQDAEYNYWEMVYCDECRVKGV